MRKIYHRSLYTKNDAGNMFFLIVLLPGIFAMLLFSILTPFFVSMGDQNKALFEALLSILSAQGGMLLVYFLYNKILKINPFKAGRISFKLKPINVMLSLLFGTVALFGFGNLISVFDALIEKMGHISKDFPLPLDNGWWLALNLFLLALLPAIVEELVFRGVIYNGLKQYGKGVAIVLSSILFALIHGNIDQTIYPILFGLVLAYIVYKTGNIIYSMLAHFINNAIVLTFNFIYTLNPNLIEDIQADTILTAEYVLIAVGITLICFVAIFFAGKLLKKMPNQTTTSLLEEIPDNFVTENIENLNLAYAKEKAPQGVDNKLWEKIICQKNDLLALEQAKKTTNTLLWISIGISLLFWFVSL